jgi:LDH2 family malate/lactate/ureidoglycolate dehydrogenase
MWHTKERAMSAASSIFEQRLVAEDLRRAVAGCARAAGAGEAAAMAMADHIVEAHLRGVETHGLRRLKPYLARISSGGVAGEAAPGIDARNAIVRIDGRNGIGHHVATLAADAVAERARTCGVAIGLVRNSNHFGFAGYYAARIATRDMLAMVASNGQVMVGPDGALRPLLSNDPLAIAAPFAGGGMLELDLALSVTSRQNIVRSAALGEAIPPGVALDCQGLPTTDAQAALDGLLLAFGGARGFALLFALEALTGVLPGGAYADLVASKEASPQSPEGTSHFMLAIDLEMAGGREAFHDRLADLVHRLQSLPMRDGMAAPRLPGQRRWQLRAERLAKGIPIAPPELHDLMDLCTQLGVEPPALKPTNT